MTIITIINHRFFELWRRLYSFLYELCACKTIIWHTSYCCKSS